MKIWMIGRSYPEPRNSLRGSFELEQAALLSKQGHTVTYLACVFHHKNRVKNWGFAEWRENGISILCYSQIFAPERFDLHFGWLRRKRWLALLERAEKQDGLPDIIHLHYPSMLCEPEVLELYRKRGVKIVSTEHWTRVLNRQLKGHQLARLRWHTESSHGMAAVSSVLAESMKELVPSKREIGIIPNVVNPLFKPSAQKSNGGAFRFVTVSRLVAWKQHDKMICAFDDMFHGRSDVTLTVVGGGNRYKRLRKLIQKRSAQGNIALAGTLPRAECARAVANADCVVCYSKHETFGVPIIEAWASGVPVIAPSGLGFLFGGNEDKLGILVNTEDTESLRSAMSAMPDKAQSFDSEYISRYASSRFSEEAVYEKIMSLYRQDR